MRGPGIQVLNGHLPSHEAWGQTDGGGATPIGLPYHTKSPGKDCTPPTPTMAPHLSRLLYSSSDMASLGNSGTSAGPHSGDSW